MRAIIVLGWKGFETSAEPVLVYCGVDGVAAMQAAAQARETGEFKRIGKLVNPRMIPLPAVPDRRPAPTPAAPAPGAPVPPAETPTPDSEAKAPKAPKAPKAK